MSSERPTSYILKDKVPVVCENLLEWAASQQENVKRVASDTIGEAYISTVFLGLDHAWEGKPMIFETMIFGGEHDQYCERCSTWEEAEEMHKRAVDLVKYIPFSSDTNSVKLPFQD